MNKLKSYHQQIRPWDVWIVLALLVLSFLPNVLFALQEARAADAKNNAQVIAVITIDGQEVKRVALTEETPNELFTYYPHDNQYNIIEVDGTRIRVKEDNSPDQIAVRTGWISKPGQTSICLPHGLMIEIISNTGQVDDTIIPL
ncbi:NusG domain II-containing protein [Granulicatella seriolae]|uniref:NusG domain II-containing protein n=1 Tax=Granulicatella seriolae TaxID=2967226 RepID=A0ABT1WMP5_9LACT|nr:NusG domain II-containing protein [Granulicatella seriolae]